MNRSNPSPPPSRETRCAPDWLVWAFICFVMAAALLIYVIWTSHDEVFHFSSDRTCKVTRWFVWPPEPYVVTLDEVEGASFKVRAQIKGSW
jgi:hypothetical protein